MYSTCTEANEAQELLPDRVRPSSLVHYCAENDSYVILVRPGWRVCRTCKGAGFVPGFDDSCPTERCESGWIQLDDRAGGS